MCMDIKNREKKKCGRGRELTMMDADSDTRRATPVEGRGGDCVKMCGPSIPGCSRVYPPPPAPAAAPEPVEAAPATVCRQLEALYFGAILPAGRTVQLPLVLGWCKYPLCAFVRVLRIGDAPLLSFCPCCLNRLRIFGTNLLICGDWLPRKCD